MAATPEYYHTGTEGAEGEWSDSRGCLGKIFHHADKNQVPPTYSKRVAKIDYVLISGILIGLLSGINPAEERP